MLIGYVSDERYVALADVLVHITWADLEEPVVARSTPRGEVYADAPARDCEVTLVKSGFGSKRVRMTPNAAKPYQFRLLADGLLGYMWPLWSTADEKSEYRVHAVEEYHLSLWRYGFKKELIQNIGWFDEHGPRAAMQITPDGDYTQTGVEWNKVGYENVILSQSLTAPERSGLYYIHARTFSEKFFSFPWVVAPKKPSAQIAILASTNTWNAYNNFGGRSNYANPTELPKTPIVNSRQDMERYTDPMPYGLANPTDDAHMPLSFDRPDRAQHVPDGVEVTDPIRGRLACHLAPAEWRLLGWMEREGFAYDYYSEGHLHEGKVSLDGYKILILSVHPEYWTREMYAQVYEWVDSRGGRLLYLGGNGVNCEVTLTADGQMHCLNHKPVDKDNNPLHESRMHRTLRSEAELLGLVFTNTGVMTGAPYKVVDEDHWIFAGTSLKNGDLFGAASQHERIPGGASGHETDKRSPFSPAGVHMMAKGTNPDDGGAEIIYYTTKSGGEVFSVGSINYVSSLLVDQNISRVTANVLSRFLA